jgi:dynein heavy chain 1
MRFNFNPREPDVLKQLAIEMADAKFYYGFEYLGLIDKLVQTPLTDRCYLTMTQALKARQGGSPFGPAGTGKTESVKSLGNQLGRFVLVFNCDETFDFHAMGRIFVGLCQVGAWGCFDEFNRLEERMLSACSQQIQSIQLGLKEGSGKDGCTAEILGRPVRIHPDMAIFITMNPGYAGRSNLPDNLKKLFRNLAMTHPDRQLIAQVMLFSQGFRSAEHLASKVVPLFILCDEQLSAQSHYDFGLRALKAVLVTAGNVKREALSLAREACIAAGQEVDEEKVAASIDEQLVLIQSISQTMIPKLVADDIPLLRSLLTDVFPGVEYVARPMEKLRALLEEVCAERNLIANETFITKMLQLYEVSRINHGLMLVGPSGAGKSTAWRVLMEALNRMPNGLQGQYHVIDPKAISKDELYGNLDSTTREWTDGIFTHVIRKIIDSVRGEKTRRQWVIFDGDVDPEWVENLNSVLDDNKLLTLPNGERLALPKNLNIIFEVQDLKFATLATVSRCGMIWFSEEVLSLDMYFKGFLNSLRNSPLEGAEDARVAEGVVSPGMLVGCLKFIHIQSRPLPSFFDSMLTFTGPAPSCVGAVTRSFR